MAKITSRAASHILLGAALFLAVPAGLRAQTASSNPPPSADDSLLHSYPLSMDHLRKLQQTLVHLTEFAQTHPEEMRAMAARDSALSASRNPTIAQSVAQMSSVPEMKQLVTSGGLTVRDYVLTTSAFFGAVMMKFAQGERSKHNMKPPDLPYNVNPANVAFLQAHDAELGKLGLDKAMQDFQKAASAATSGGGR